VLFEACILECLEIVLVHRHATLLISKGEIGFIFTKAIAIKTY